MNREETPSREPVRPAITARSCGFAARDGVRLFRVRNWELHFEKHENGRVKSMKWIPVPVAHDGKGFRRLMSAQNYADPRGSAQNGATTYGCWILILQVAAKCCERGTLADEDGPLTAEDLSFKTGARVEDFNASIPILLQVGWLEEIRVDSKKQSAQKCADPRRSAPVENSTVQENTEQNKQTTTIVSSSLRSEETAGKPAESNAKSVTGVTGVVRNTPLANFNAFLDDTAPADDSAALTGPLQAGSPPAPQDEPPPPDDLDIPLDGDNGSPAAPETPQSSTKKLGKRTKKPAKSTKATGSPMAEKPADGGLVWSMWVDVNRDFHQSDPVPTGPDTAAARELAKLVKPDELRLILADYLDDEDKFLMETGHALRHLAGRINKYRGKARGPDDFNQIVERITRRGKRERGIA